MSHISRQKHICPLCCILFFEVISMAYEEISRKIQKTHTVNISDRTSMTITGVEEALGFDETSVLVRTSLGELCVRGEALHVERIDLDTGELELRGKIGELNYDEPKESGGFWAKLFS